MVRLLADVAVVTGGVVAQKRRLMEGIAELSGSDFWMWNVGVIDRENQVPAAVSVLHNFSERQLATLTSEAYQHNGAHRRLNQAFIDLSMKKPSWTRSIDDLMDDETGGSAGQLREHMAQVEISDSIMSFRAVPEHPDLYSGIGLHRGPDRPCYGPRELRMVHILLDEVAWLHEAGGAAEEEAGQVMIGLSPRRQTVLTLLVDGHSAKRIAYHLELSEHTIKGYIKDIYRHYDVGSRAELMRRFMLGDGGDLAEGRTVGGATDTPAGG